MSTKTTTTNTGQFNQPSMSTFNALQPTIGTALSSNINNPYSNMFFNNQLAMGQQALGQQNASATQALMQRASALGINPQSPLYFSQLNQLQRQNMANNSNLYNNLLLQAGNYRMQSLGMAQNYRPFQTGSTSTQTKSGVGTWLSPLVSAGIGAATGGMGGGGFGSPMSMFSPSQSVGSNPTLMNTFGANASPDMLNTTMAPNSGTLQGY